MATDNTSALGLQYETGPERGDADASPPSGRSRKVLVLNELGLHARPAAKLAQEAQRFASDIRLVVGGPGGQEVDAKSILDILTLAVGKGSGLELKADGVDAEEALAHLGRLFESRFDEAR